MTIQLNIFLSFAISFTIVYFVIPKIIKVSTIKKLFDVPNHRSAAKQIVPTLGGISILAGFIISLIISSDNFNIDELKHLIAGVIVMFIIGLKDDIIGLSARKKFIIQLLMTIYLVVLGHYRITNLHGLFGINEIGYISGTIISIFAIVGIINSINLIDGIDGLASGICLVITSVYGVWFLNAGDFLYALVCFSLAGSLIAFFMYNVFGKTNKIFMGDTGSLILGTVVAVLTVRFNEFVPLHELSINGLPAISLAIIIVPVIDTIRVFAIRILKGKSPFSPDMNHIHHNILKLTHNHLISSSIIVSANILIILLAFNLIDILGNNILFILLIILALFLAQVPVWILRYQNKNAEPIISKESIFALFVFHKNREE